MLSASWSNRTFSSVTSPKILIANPGPGNSGTVSLQAPHNPGAYWLGWVSEGDLQFKVRTFFQVVIPNTAMNIAGYSLTPALNPVNPGGGLSVNWSKPPGAPGGFIGVYGSQDHTPQEGVNSFLSLAFPSGSVTSGTVGITIPNTPGAYWLGWVSNADSQFKVLVPFSVISTMFIGGVMGWIWERTDRKTSDTYMDRRYWRHTFMSRVAST